MREPGAARSLAKRGSRPNHELMEPAIQSGSHEAQENLLLPRATTLK